jgi:hypothetical protein
MDFEVDDLDEAEALLRQHGATRLDSHPASTPTRHGSGSCSTRRATRSASAQGSNPAHATQPPALLLGPPALVREPAGGVGTQRHFSALGHEVVAELIDIWCRFSDLAHIS